MEAGVSNRNRCQVQLGIPEKLAQDSTSHKDNRIWVSASLETRDTGDV